jgi:hypothetical protein
LSSFREITFVCCRCYLFESGLIVLFLATSPRQCIPFWFFFSLASVFLIRFVGRFSPICPSESSLQAARSAWSGTKYELN